jgi:tetratricopeptide (TPR) repeat protein
MKPAAALVAAVVLLCGCAETQFLTPVSPLLGAPLSIRIRDDDARRKIAELERKGDWQTLAILAAQVSARDPADEDWLVILGYARLEAGDYRQAIDVLRQAAERVPEDVDPRNLQGEALRLSGQSEQAIQVLERSVMSHPNSPAGWFLLGEAYSDARRLERARAAYSESVRIEPEYGMGWFGLAGILARVGPRGEYEEVLKRLKAVNPELMEAHLKAVSADKAHE